MEGLLSTGPTPSSFYETSLEKVGKKKIVGNLVLLLIVYFKFSWLFVFFLCKGMVLNVIMYDYTTQLTLRLSTFSY